MTSQSDASNSNRSSRLRLTFVIVLITLLALSLLAVQTERSGCSPDTIRQRGVLRVGYAVEAPYAFNTLDGTITGESPELVKHIAKQLEFPRIEWVQTSFERLIPELEADRFDVIASGLFMTPERAERVLFSRPTFVARAGLLVLLGNPRQLTSVDDVVRSRWIQIAVIDGAVEAERLKLAGVAESQLIPVPDAATGRAAVQSGSVAGLALSAATVRWIVAENSREFESIVPFESRSQEPARQLGGLAFRKDAEELRKAFDEILNSYIGTHEHLELVGRFGFSSSDVPSETSAAEVLP